MRLRAGEVLHRRAAALGRHEAQVGLIAAAQADARLGVAAGRARARRAGGRRRRPSRAARAPPAQDVDVAAGLAPAAQAADRDELGGRRVRRAGGDELVATAPWCRTAGGGPRPCCRSSIGLEDQRFLLRPHALAASRRRPARAAAARSSTLAMLSVRVEQRDRLRTDALQPQQVENGRRKLLRAAPGGRRQVPVSASSRICAARSLPMPGSSRSCGSVMRATGSADGRRWCRRPSDTRES